VTQRDLCLRIVAGGGHYLLPVDENQPALLAAAEAAFSPWTAPDPDGHAPPTTEPWLVAELARPGGGCPLGDDGGDRR
jgi:hypothetical protein